MLPLWEVDVKKDVTEWRGSKGAVAALVFGIAFGAMVGCGAAVKMSESDVNFAHYPASQLFGTPLSLALFQKSGALAKDKLRVCVEAQLSGLSEAEVMLEVRLAFAAWWKSSGIDPVTWSALDFQSRSDCTGAEGWDSVVVVPGPTRTDNAFLQLGTRFGAISYSCDRSGGSARCRSATYTLGVGGPAAVRVLSRPGDGAVVGIEVASPASAVMSPAVDWYGLRQAIKLADIDTAESRVALVAQFDRLAQGGTVDLESLASFAESLKAADLRVGDDPVLQSKLSDFAASGAESLLEAIYRPRIALFSTLLHEIGHQFGMDHADNPGPDSIMGSAVDQNGRPDVRFVTELSVMAYALPYLYLTDDDRAGISSVFRTLKQP
jgi:hypothetical protein